MNRILVLGAGMVSQPLVIYLLGKGFFLTVADMNGEKARSVINKLPLAVATELDINNDDELAALIAKHDIVVSLLPNTMHIQVLRQCIKLNKSMVTTSYQSQAMLELKSQIEESGITVLNEMGLDPGLDHMSARRIIDRVHSQQGQVLNFYSLCGALPAPEAANNPLAYKFTWSPSGVMVASLNSAQYLNNGEIVTVPADQLFHNPFKVDFPDLGILDVYPNRDSIAYIKDYGIDEVKTMLRGTIRLPGWCETLDALRKLGLLDQQLTSMEHMTYFNLLERTVGTLYPEYESQIARFLQLPEDATAIKSLKWLGYFSNEPIGRLADSPFNVTRDLMFSRMMLPYGERDMVVMQHEFLVRYPGDREESIISRLLEYGDEKGHTAISRTVALPAAIATELILTGELKQKGLLRPFTPEIYEPVLKHLEEEGICMKEEITQLV